MKGLFYPKFAFNSIKKNKKLYIPYILTSILWVMMFYIITALSKSPYLEFIRGGWALETILNLGGPVILFFSFLFLVYTNSFINKRRDKEYALYNILGMNKKNIAHILSWDTIITFGISIIVGLLFGTLFFKVAELCLLNIVKSDVSYNLYISWETVLFSVVGYAVIFILILLGSLLRIKISNPIELLHSESSGEKPPKANWFIGILGLISLGIAYYISITVKNPIAAVTVFFLAVILVIIGTYLLFVSGSVLMCRILQKNKSYYYKSNHFISVSSMMHRMKRNGAGLAAICVLATMVLVMISSTTSLLFGIEDSLLKRYPQEMNIKLHMKSSNINDDLVKSLDSFVAEACNKFNATPKNKEYYREVDFAAEIKDGVFNLKSSGFSSSFDNVYQMFIVPVDDYNRIMNKSEVLKPNEIMFFSTKSGFTNDTITFDNGNTFNIVKYLDEFWSDGSSSMMALPSIFMVVSDLEYANKNIGLTSNTILTYGFDSGLSDKEQIELFEDIYKEFDTLIATNNNVDRSQFESRASDKADYYGMYGGLFFIGIILSILFISAAVLIIYYKQIVEGYEDKSRFEIMQKVGMNKKEIKKSINSQLLTVFFMPLAFAGMHLAFAFPIIKRLLLIFNLNNTLLFAMTSIISFVVFGLFYSFIYRVTSNSYYNIVSNRESN